MLLTELSEITSLLQGDGECKKSSFLCEVLNGFFFYVYYFILFTLNFTTYFVQVSWSPSAIPSSWAAAFVTTLCVHFQLIYKFVEKGGLSTRSLMNFVISLHCKTCQFTHFLGFYSIISFYLNEDFPSCALQPIFIFNYHIN